MTTTHSGVAPQPPTDYKALYRKLERTIGTIEQMQDTAHLLSECLRSLVEDFENILGFVGGRIYRREEDDYVLKVRIGRSKRAPIGYRIPASYGPIQKILEDDFLIMRRSDPGFDETIEGAIGVSNFAAFVVDDDNRHIVSLTIKGRIDEEHILYAINGVRHIINMKIRQQRLNDVIHEARDIQLSILPKSPPDFPGYDIAAESHPADIVGGDLFDYVHQTERLLGVAVADASGHGLPAALQARDVITGMRMGMAENLKIISAIENLNEVVHRSSISSRFVSLFYGEVEMNGNFIYCNAGHPPALHLSKGVFTELKLGGIVLGPAPGARYERGFARLERGDLVVMYTDGVTETANRREEEFGLERLQGVIAKHKNRPAAEIVRSIFESVGSFSGSEPQVDDRTVMVLRRL